MANTKVAKKKPKQTSVTLRFISDARHGWVEVPKSLLKKVGMSPDDYGSCGKFCYLEEDCEAADLDRAAKRHGVSITYAEHEMDDFESWVGGPQWPYIPACVYGDDRELVANALDSLGIEMKQCSLDQTRSAGERAAFRQRWEDCMRLSLMFSTMNGVEK